MIAATRLSLACASLCRRFSSAPKNSFGSPLPQVIQESGWEGAWSKGVTPWDAGRPTPYLEHWLKQNAANCIGKRALVPGCGSAYDVIAFAKAGMQVIGLDLSETAAEVAKEKAEASKHAANIRIDIADFFTYASKPFDVIYDYTFMTALPPEMWGAWAQTMRRLLKPEGKLLTMIFPIGDFEGGPPFAVKPETVKDLLESNDFVCDDMHAVPAELSHKGRANREYFAVWHTEPWRYPSIHIPSGVATKQPAKRSRKEK